MNQTKPYTIGLDLGGTNSEFGIVDHEGNIIASSTMKTGGYAGSWRCGSRPSARRAPCP